MNILSTLLSWFNSPRRFTDVELLAGPEGDCIDHGFSWTEEDHIRVLEHRKNANQLSERQRLLINDYIEHLRHCVATRAPARPSVVRRSRPSAEADRKQSPSIRASQPLDCEGQLPVQPTVYSTSFDSESSYSSSRSSSYSDSSSSSSSDSSSSGSYD